MSTPQIRQKVTIDQILKEEFPLTDCLNLEIKLLDFKQNKKLYSCCRYCYFNEGVLKNS